MSSAGLPSTPSAKLQHHVGHGRLQLASVWAQPAAAHIVHPGAAAFALAGGLVEVELTDQLAVALQAVELHVRVPHGSLVFDDLHVKQVLNDSEQTGEHLGRGEVLFHFLLAEGVARFLELFGDVGPVPRLWVGQAQFLGCKLAQVVPRLFRRRGGPAGPDREKVDDLLGRLAILGTKDTWAKFWVAQQLRFFLAQRQDFFDDGGVVVLDQVAFRLV